MNFFGLNNEYRNTFRHEVLNLAMNSDGGISYTEARLMPVSLRRWNIKKINEEREKQNEAQKKAAGDNTMTMQDIIKRIPAKADYVTKAPRKK